MISITTTTHEQAPLVQSIVHAAFAEYDGKLPVQPGALHEPITEVEKAIAEGRTLLGWDGGQAVGTVRYELHPDHLYVGRLAVLPSHRRLGVGAALMAYLEALAVRLGQTRIRLGTRQSMPSNLAFYERLDYRIISREPHSRGPDIIVWFEKQLDPPAK